MPRYLPTNRKSASRRARKPTGGANRLNGFEPLEERIALSATPFGAQPGDTAEFLLGSVNVSVVLLESNDVSSNDNPTAGTPREENWTDASIAAVKQKVTDGLQWWDDTLADITDKHQLSFNIDFTHADTPVSTRFEPITQPASDYQYWTREFLDVSGVESTGFLFTDIAAYNHQQREANDQNWGFTIFVVNDEHDPDHRFDVTNGGLDRAFAFPGGLFLVTLASRPASTISHEMGHIFWALDEYQGGGVHDTTRGYYDTPNTNAWNNPIFNSGQQREPSIMDRGACEEGGGLLCDAYEQNTSSQSSFDLLGWRDSDGDGIFDVLDVEHSLEGTGYYDPATGLYRFVGESSVQTLPNLNPRQSALPTESLQNDITINRISRVEYRVDGGAWQTAATPDTYVAALDLSFAVPATASQVEIRTIDAVTGVTSPLFVTDLTRPASTPQSGVSGFVFGDSDGDGQIETGEDGLAGRTVQLVNASGQPISLQKGIEPDDYAPNTDLGNVIPEATLTALGSATSGTTVFARSVGQGSTGSQAFSVCSFAGSGDSCNIYATEWTSSTRQLRVDFAAPVTTVSIDALSNHPLDYGRLAVYDANDILLARYTTDALASGQVETMTLSRPSGDIAYAIAGGHANTGVRLDNLRFGATASAVTDELGAYSIANLELGSYRVQVPSVAGSQATTSTTQSVTLSVSAPAASVDFGFEAFVSPWQNPTNRFDVSNDGALSPIDALLVINDLSVNGPRILTASDSTPPYIDVDGDGNVAPIDVLQVINAIEAQASEGEASGLDQPVVVTADNASLAAEGEFVPAIQGHAETQLAHRTVWETLAPVETVRDPLFFPSHASLTDSIESGRKLRAVELAVIDTHGYSTDLEDDPLSDLLDTIADDVAARWENLPLEN